MCFLHRLLSPGIEKFSARRLRAANSCFVKGSAPEQHHFVRALLREHASFDSPMMLSHFMVQLVKLIAEFYDQHGFLMKDVILCNVGLRSLQERTVLLLRVTGRGAWKTGRGGG